MIAFDSLQCEFVSVAKHSNHQAARLYLYFMGTYTQEWQEYDLETVGEEMGLSRPTIYRAFNFLIKKKYVETQPSKKLTRIRLQNLSLTGETTKCVQSLTSETTNSHIRNIKRERVYYFILLNIIFLFLKKEIFPSLSDIPYRDKNEAFTVSPVRLQSIRYETTTETIQETDGNGQKTNNNCCLEQKYLFSEEFYQQIEDLGIRLNAELKKRLDLLGVEKVTDLYYQVTWDSSIRKPGTIFLKEVMKAYEEKRKEKAENRKQASNYQTWAGSRELSLKEIYDSYKRNRNMDEEKVIKFWKEKSKFFGYTEKEMAEFIEKQNGAELERESKLTAESGENVDEMGLSLNALEEGVDGDLAF